MKDFPPILEDCLTRLSNGTTTVDECLTRYAEYAGQLKPLLQTALLLSRGRDVMPSPAFNAYTRSVVVQHARSRLHRTQGIALSWRMAMTFAMLVAALLVTGTVHAQSALPGDIDYGWKRTSELAWRAMTPDPLSADIILVNRRLDEWIAVANHPALSASARNDYQDALSELASTDDAKALSLIMPVLQKHQQLLNDAGLPTSELDGYLIKAADLPPVNMSNQTTPTEIAPDTCALNCGDDMSGGPKDNGKGINDHNGDGHEDNGKGKGNDKGNDKGNNKGGKGHP